MFVPELSACAEFLALEETLDDSAIGGQLEEAAWPYGSRAVVHGVRDYQSLGVVRTRRRSHTAMSA